MKLSVIAHNIRSTHNIGSIFRTCEGFGIEKLYLSGYSPYPKLEADTRLPHLAEKLENQIHKTALGAERLVPFAYMESIEAVIEQLKNDGYSIVGLEQAPGAVMLPEFQPSDKVVLLLGEEVEGIPADVQKLCDNFVEIPMQGQKESFNVSVAAGIAMYGLLYRNTL